MESAPGVIPVAPDGPAKGDVEMLVGLYSQGRFRELASLATTVAGRFPDHAIGWQALGVACLELGQYPDALAALQTAAMLCENDAETLGNLADALNQTGRPQEAETVCRKALQMTPGVSELHLNLANALQAQGRLDESLAEYEMALAIAPDDPDTHSNIGVIAVRLGQYDRALASFSKALELAPRLAQAIHGLNDLRSRLVPQWHVPMMNEQDRNEAYRAAIQSAVGPASTVFEIGTGSGLLAMMAARAGACSVTTCEAEPNIAAAAIRIVANNGYADRITVVGKRSTAVEIGIDLPAKADVLVAEIFSSELLGEHVLPSVEDAKRRLLKSGGRVIPAAGSIVIALFGGEDLRRNLFPDVSSGFDLREFGSLVPTKALLARDDLEIDLLSDEVEAFRFDFANQHSFPGETGRLAIPVLRSGRCLGIIQWLRLQLDANTRFENHPCTKSPVANWQRVAYKFDEPRDVAAGDTILITATHDRNLPWFFLDEIIPATPLLNGNGKPGQASPCAA